jgi:hypothetical protein
MLALRCCQVAALCMLAPCCHRVDNISTMLTASRQHLDDVDAVLIHLTTPMTHWPPVVTMLTPCLHHVGTMLTPCWNTQDPVGTLWRPCGDTGAERHRLCQTGSLCLGVSVIWVWPVSHPLGRSGLVLTVLAMLWNGHATHASPRHSLGRSGLVLNCLVPRLGVP